MNRKERISFENYNYKKHDYEIIEDPKNNDFETLAKKLIEMNSSFQVDGRAGTGKSTLLKHIIKVLRKNKSSFITLAPTHKACRVLHDEALTVHSFFTKFTEQSYKKLNKYEYIIIDEKSMIKELFYRVFCSIKKNTTCKFIIAGDFGQLPPVQDRSDFDYENSSALHYLCDGKLMKLTECRRSDRILFDLCADVSKVNVNDFGHVMMPRSVSYHNSKRKLVNKMWMERKRNNNYVTIPRCKADKRSQDIDLYVGLPLIACKTVGKYDIANGEEFVVDSYNKVIVVLKSNDLVKKVALADIGNYFYPAYCLTVHMSQGSTFTGAYTIYEWDKMNDKLKYVALSRSTKKEHINFV